MANTDLAQVFEAKAVPPPEMGVEAYRIMLEKLLTEGMGYGKTQPVAAYKLRNMRLVNKTKAGEEEHNIVLPDLYVVMDISEWKNEYIRGLEMEDIAVQWARRIIDDGDINGADFKGSGIWTTRVKALEHDYIKRVGVDVDGRPLNIYDPNPEAVRVCIPVTDPVTIPTAWGTPYPVGTDGTIVIRERDVPALAEALQSIREGQTTALEALYKKDENGKLVARFDVYGMEPGFIGKNYDPVPLRDAALDIQARFRALPALPPPPNEGEKLPPAAEELLARYSFTDLPQDGAVFFAVGSRISNPEDRSDVPENDQLVQSFIDANDAIAGERKYRDMLDYVDRWGGNHFHTTGRGDRVLSHMAKDISHFEEAEFWRRLQTHFAQAARGTVHVAADNGIANDNFRLFGYPAIMANDNITDVEMITGQPLTLHASPYVDIPAKKFMRAATHDEYDDAKKRLGDDNVRLVYDDMIFDESLQTRPRDEWAEEQKQRWFVTAASKLIAHMRRKPIAPTLKIIGAYYHDAAREDLIIARVNFVQEVVFSLREAKRLRALAGEGDETAAAMLKQERRRLDQAFRLLDRHPDILTFDDNPPSALEIERSHYARGKIARVYVMTQRLGDMLLKLDDSMTLAEKNALWGRYEDYDHARYSRSDEPNPNLGRPREVEEYVREKLAGLKGEITAELNANNYKVLQFPAPAHQL